MIFFVGYGLDEVEREYGVRFDDIIRLWGSSEVGMIVVANPERAEYEQFNISIETFQRLKEELNAISIGGDFTDV